MISFDLISLKMYCCQTKASIPQAECRLELHQLPVPCLPYLISHMRFLKKKMTLWRKICDSWRQFCENKACTGFDEVVDPRFHQMKFHLAGVSLLLLATCFCPKFMLKFFFLHKIHNIHIEKFKNLPSPLKETKVGLPWPFLVMTFANLSLRASSLV